MENGIYPFVQQSGWSTFGPGVNLFTLYNDAVATISLYAGGGAGGGNIGGYGGGGGGSGAQIRGKKIFLRSGKYRMTVGAGGNGNAGATGGAGGNTTLEHFHYGKWCFVATVTGGLGGITQTGGGPGGQGGTVIGDMQNSLNGLTGVTGGTPSSGNGADSPWEEFGLGGPSVGQNVAGVGGTGRYSAGGGGAGGRTAGTASGGPGLDGYAEISLTGGNRKFLS